MSKRLVSMLIALTFATGAIAQGWFEKRYPLSPSEAELQRLPPLCRAKFQGPPAAAESWQRQIGLDDFQHAHHLCFGLNAANRYYLGRVDVKDGPGLARVAFKEFEYSLRAMSQGFYLRPEVEMIWARLLVSENQPAEAIKHYREAIRLKPSHPLPYLGLADVFERLKLKDDAIATLREGLEKAPENPALARRYRELSGVPWTAPSPASSPSTVGPKPVAPNPAASSNAGRPGEEPVRSDQGVVDKSGAGDRPQ